LEEKLVLGDEVVITGIVDWDECESLPIELAYFVPSWLWTSELACDGTWDVTPRNEQEATIRDIFKTHMETYIENYFELTSEFRNNRDLQALGLLARRGEDFQFIIDQGKRLLRIHDVTKYSCLPTVAVNKISSNASDDDIQTTQQDMKLLLEHEN